MPVLTSSIINNAEIKDKIYYIWDDMVKGFALKVIPNGQKKYVIKYRTSMGGRNAVQRWYIFGDIQNLSCKEAREEAAKLFLMIHDGKDPQEEKASLRKADTLAEFWEVFKRDYVELKENKETYLKNNEQLWRLYIKPVLGNRKITDINNLDIEHLHRSLARVKYNANRMLSLLNLLFNLMEKWKLRTPNSNPCTCVQRYKEELRIRYLSSEEMERFSEELRKAEKRTPEMLYTVAAIRLLLLTAARKNEILTCKWEWVDFDNSLINLPDSKTGQKTIFLNSKALEILNQLYARPERELGYDENGRMTFEKVEMEDDTQIQEEPQENAPLSFSENALEEVQENEDDEWKGFPPETIVPIPTDEIDEEICNVKSEKVKKSKKNRTKRSRKNK